MPNIEYSLNLQHLPQIFVFIPFTSLPSILASGIFYAYFLVPEPMPILL